MPRSLRRPRKAFWLLPLALLVQPALAADPTCTAPAAWFPTTPEPDGSQFPASPNNCDFHQWAYQTFLWLGEPSSGSGGAPLNFDTLANAQALLTPGGRTQPDRGRAAGEGLSVMARVAKSQDSVDAND